MAENWLGWRLGLASCLAFVGAMTDSRNSAIAQITPDRTLGGENSVVAPNESINGVESDRIEGGAIRGANLFHSFEQFNVGEGRGAYFTNPAGVENILSRVTGNIPSNILGRLGVLGNANLFLINPNGIVFGPNASLDVRGSFVATTANAVGLGDRGLFSATEPQTSNLLAVNPSVFFFNAVTAQNIVNQSQAQGLNGETNSDGTPKLVGLQVPTDNTLALIGGNVILEKGNLTAPGGRIELGSVSGVGEVNLSQNGEDWVFGYDRVNSFGEIRLQDKFLPIDSPEALVDVSGESSGGIQIRGSQLEMVEARIFANTQGAGESGDVFIRTSDTISLSAGSQIAADVLNGATGTGGAVTLETGQLRLQNGSFIEANSDNSMGQAGNLIVTASESVELVGIREILSPEGERERLVPSGLFAQPQETGATGDLTVNTERLVVRDGATISVSVRGEGQGGNLTVNASDSIDLEGTSPYGKELFSGLLAQSPATATGDTGNLTINTGRLVIRDGAVISASTFGEGQGGNLTVNASDSIDLAGTTPDGEAPSGLFTSTQETGDAGNLTIDTGRLVVSDGAVVSARTSGEGNGGEITVNASNVNLFGVNASGLPSSLLALTSESGQGGSIRVNTSAFRVADGAVVDARTITTGNSGNIVINTDTFEAVNGGQVVANAYDNSSGLAGTIEVNATNINISGSFSNPTQRFIRINSNSRVENTDPTDSGLFVLSRGTGNAGSLNVTTNSISLDDGGRLQASTTSGDGGNINLQARDFIFLRDRSLISAQAGGTGNGGNITINTPFIFATPQEDSDILANASTGTGGNITIDASGIFGIEERDPRTPLSDINASSAFGAPGVVEFNAAEFDPSREVVPTPNIPTQTPVVQACQPSGNQAQSQFIITGRGGLPASPDQALSSDAVRVDWVTTDSQTAREQHEGESNVSTPRHDRIVEAQGWRRDRNGKTILIASASMSKPYDSMLTSTGCHAAPARN
jgi:filamentous hemagglutinin family protein